MFSICVCSWNDLGYLKLLYSSIKKYTKLPYEFLVHDNGSDDGTKEWLENNSIKYTRSDKNLGVGAVNFAVEKAKYKYIIDINADMVCLPGWDTEIFKKIKYFESKKIDKFIISSRLIEPAGNNLEYRIHYHGHNYETFDEIGLVYYYCNEMYYKDFQNTNQYSHPICMPKKMWDEFGGVDMSYEYGIATDHDIPACAYRVGCRNFVELCKPTIYHFSFKTVSKLPQNRPNGQKRFLEKYGISIDDFRRKMKIGQKYHTLEDNIL